MIKKTQRRIRKDDRGLRRLLAESAAERQQLKQDRPPADFKAAAERAKAWLVAAREQKPIKVRLRVVGGRVEFEPCPGVYAQGNELWVDGRQIVVTLAE